MTKYTRICLHVRVKLKSDAFTILSNRVRAVVPAGRTARPAGWRPTRRCHLRSSMWNRAGGSRAARRRTCGWVIRCPSRRAGPAAGRDRSGRAVRRRRTSPVAGLDPTGRALCPWRDHRDAIPGWHPGWNRPVSRATRPIGSGCLRALHERFKRMVGMSPHAYRATFLADPITSGHGVSPGGVAAGRRCRHCGRGGRDSGRLAARRPDRWRGHGCGARGARRVRRTRAGAGRPWARCRTKCSAAAPNASVS